MEHKKNEVCTFYMRIRSINRNIMCKCTYKSCSNKGVKYKSSTSQNAGAKEKLSFIILYISSWVAIQCKLTDTFYLLL